MTRATPEQREKELADLRKWVDVAVKLGARHIRVFGGDVPKGVTEDDAASWVVEVLKRGAEYAGANGVILGLENHGGITARAERIIDIVKRVDSPWVAVNLDTGNFRTDPLPQIQQCIPYAANVQVKANTEWDRIIGMLASAGYRGYLALEYEAAEPAPSAVPKLIGKLRELCAKYS
jgi:sugar phosphate isomerase/epimerase